MDKSRVEPTFFFIGKISFSLKLFSGHFYGQSFNKTIRGPLSKWNGVICLKSKLDSGNSCTRIQLNKHIVLEDLISPR